MRGGDHNALVLACSEAAANAIEHGCRGQPGHMRVLAALDDQHVWASEPVHRAMWLTGASGALGVLG